MVLQLQHSDMKMGLVGICSWQDCAFWRFWCEKPCTSIVLDNRSLKVTAAASNAPSAPPVRNRTQDQRWRRTHVGEGGAGAVILLGDLLEARPARLAVAFASPLSVSNKA